MKNKSIYLLLIFYSVVAALTIIYFDGTGDTGDSIYHYQFARYAPLHPHLFFDHWAKPVYVLLACPFAQFGFIGIKIFNVIVSLITIYLTFKIIQKLEIKNEIIGAIIYIFSPLYFILTFSGLTEPLFALFLCFGIYAVLQNKFITAGIIISFLPFIRSEGLIIIFVFGLYFMIKRKWKYLPMLFLGHLIYSIAGYFVYDDLLWVFNKIPYTSMSKNYGFGNLAHFDIQLLYVVGVPIYFLFWMGIIGIIWKSFKKKISLEVLVLIFIGFISYFLFHTLAWNLGIFNSMGLKRVLLGIAPLISIISLIGFNFIIVELLKKNLTAKLVIQYLLIAYIVVFPFTPNKAAILWQQDLCLKTDQVSAIKLGNFVTKETGLNHRFIFVHPYLSEVLNIDPFDSNKHMEFVDGFINLIKPGDILIWENWYASSEYGVSQNFLDTYPGLINIYRSNDKDIGNREVLYSVYRYK